MNTTQKEVKTMKKSLSTEREWIQCLLSEWGVWRRQEEYSLIPPHARLRTGGGDIASTEDELILTNQAVLHLRELSYPHYIIIESYYKEYPGEKPGKIINKIKGVIRLNPKRPGAQFAEMRNEAESKIASFRQDMVFLGNALTNSSE